MSTAVNGFGGARSIAGGASGAGVDQPRAGAVSFQELLEQAGVNISRPANEAEAAKVYNSALERCGGYAGTAAWGSLDWEANYAAQTNFEARSALSKQGSVITLAAADNKGAPTASSAMLTLTGKHGLQITLKVEENIRINEAEDGSVSLYYLQSGLVRSFDRAGNESLGELDPAKVEATLGSAADDIIINLNAELVDSGDGDDIIFNLADNATIRGGAGNDKILLPGRLNNVKVDGGEGEDLIAAELLCGAEISLGAKDKLGANMLESSRVTDEGGSMRIDSLNKSEISSANGLELEAAWVSDSRIVAGGGSRLLAYHSLSGSEIIFQGGDNFVRVGNLNGSSLRSGDGKDNFSFLSFYDSSLEAGDGEKVFYAGAMFNSSLKTGDGDNSVTVGGSAAEARIEVGNGDNYISVFQFDDSRMKLGNGNNHIAVARSENGEVNTGKGENKFLLSDWDKVRPHADKFQSSFRINGEGRNWVYEISYYDGVWDELAGAPHAAKNAYKAQAGIFQSALKDATLIESPEEKEPQELEGRGIDLRATYAAKGLDGYLDELERSAADALAGISV